MRRLWLALLFFAGGLAHEVRNPANCHLVAVRQGAEPRKRKELR